MVTSVTEGCRHQAADVIAGGLWSMAKIQEDRLHSGGCRQEDYTDLT
jgi:hypothetical protein